MQKSTIHARRQFASALVNGHNGRLKVIITAATAIIIGVFLSTA